MDRAINKRAQLKGTRESEDFGAKIGRNLKGGEVIVLISDLGGGKTTIARGIAKGAGSLDHVSSPSFTIRNDYRAKNVLIAHFDFYRIDEPGTLRDLLAEALTDPETSVLIEWGDVVDDILPADQIKIWLEPSENDTRLAKLSYPERFSYLFKGVF